MAEFILAGDIGGTKTRLSLYDENTGPTEPVEKETFSSKDFSSLSEIVKTYLAKKSVSVRLACFGVAGPVKDGQVSATNLPWKITEDSLRAVVDDVPVFLLNDLFASSHAIPFLEAEDLVTINRGKPQPQGAVGLVSPGTGLGEAFLTWDGKRYQAYPSEGGHCSFAPTTTNQSALLTFLMSRYGHISYERVCSGIGIANLYAYFRKVEQADEPAWLRAELDSVSDPNPTLFRAALQEDVSIAKQTLTLFIEILANEASNLALKVMASGGIYLGGGLPPRLKDWIEPGHFMSAFTNKGRFRTWLNDIPVNIIKQQDSALIGAACYGFEQLGYKPEKRLWNHESRMV